MTVTGIGQLTDHFMRWQGLRWLPTSLTAFMAAALLWVTPSSQAFLLIAAVGLSAATVAERWVNTYYERSFGHIQDRRGRRLLFHALRYGVIVPGVAAGVIDLYVRLPIVLTAWVAAAAFLVFWTVTGRNRAHWPVLAAALLLCSFAPAAGITATGRPSVVVIILFAAAAELVGGLLDHRMLLTRIGEARHDLSR